MIDNLIFDVGMNNGDDSAYYLSQGYRVVAIEADPTLTAIASQRFAAFIATGQLTILNVAIAEKAGETEFWICEANREWNSFDPRIAGRTGQPPKRIVIPTVRFAAIIGTHGTPHYLKIDIEGCDQLCLLDLQASDLPRFISLESECPPLDSTESDQGLESLNLLGTLGYHRFKLINQATYAPLAKRRRLSEAVDFLARRLAQAMHGVAGVKPMSERLTFRGRYERKLRRTFPFGCSGPWGNDLEGQWYSLGEAKEVFIAARNRHFRRYANVPFSFWCDWHAMLPEVS